MTRTVFSVTQVNRYVKKMLEADVLLAGIFVEGELSNVNVHGSGHVYFTLRDDAAGIGGVMFRGSASNLEFTPRSGMKVVAFGRLSLYEKTGQYQFYAEFMEQSGAGDLQKAFHALKEKLAAEGLFDAARKREIPRYAQSVAVITSPTGAAVQDIIRIIRGRNRAVKIIICPAIVQGENAAPDLTRALAEANEYGADTIIIGRGGGSAEDLAAFNDEALVRAVAASAIPVISAVGHETDFTLTDFAADFRAPTPTAAAQTAVYDLQETAGYLREMHIALSQGMEQKIRHHRDGITAQLRRLNSAINTRLIHERQNLTRLEELLEKISPYAVFARGFAITQREGEVIRSAKNLAPGQEIEITYADGRVLATISELKC